MNKVLNRLYLGDVVATGKSKQFRELCRGTGALYDTNNNLIASWDTLVNTYGMNCEKEYTSSTYKTDNASPYYILSNNSALSSGTRLVIDESVTNVGNYAFKDCTWLESIKIPSSVVKFGEGAFDCCQFNEVYYEGDIASWCAIDIATSEYSEGEIGEDNGSESNIIEIVCGSPCCKNTQLYIDGEKVVNLVIPLGVTSIGDATFRHCSTLTSVEIPDSVNYIGNSSSAFCTSLTSVAIPNSVTKIGCSAFAGCSSLTSGNIPTNITYVPYGMYMETPITSITIPDGVTYVGMAAFQLCTKLTSIVIPNSVTSIKDGGFCQCTSLKTITLGSGITDIGQIAFAYAPCTRITIYDNVTSISYGAFYGTSLTSATFKDTTGWYVTSTEGATSGTNLSTSNLANTSTAATYLKSTYGLRYWYKK